MNARPHLSAPSVTVLSQGLGSAVAALSPTLDEALPPPISPPISPAFEDSPSESPAAATTRPAPAPAGPYEEALFRKLVQDHRQRLYRFVVKHIGWGTDAEDITQQAFVEAAHSFATFKGESELSTWLYQGRPDGWVEVQAEVRGASLHLLLRDRGPAFDPRSAPWPDASSPLEGRPVGGLGLMFVQRLADELSYRRVPEAGGGGINELRITRHFAHPAR